MAQIVEAIFTGGVLKPLEDLALEESQKVRLIVEPIGVAPPDREAAVKKLREGIESMKFFSEGRLPSRDELHDRV
jgi:predicted DNA-binding antitoxin AbrB/MazE fold protein